MLTTHGLIFLFSALKVWHYFAIIKLEGLMSILKDFFDNLKRNKKIENPTTKVEGKKQVQPTLTVFDSSGFETEKQQAIQELIQIQNGGEFNSSDVVVLTKQVDLPQTNIGVGSSELSFSEILAGNNQLLYHSMHEFVILKKYGPHHAVALLMEKNQITDNVKFQSYDPSNEHSTEIIINGSTVNDWISIEEACKSRWAGDYFFNNYNGWKSNNFLKPTLSDYNKNASNFETSGDFATNRTLNNLLIDLVNKMANAERGATAEQIYKAIELLGGQFLQDVEKYANNVGKVSEGIKKSMEDAKNYAHYILFERTK